jgi:hypothetical protein
MIFAEGCQAWKGGLSTIFAKGSQACKVAFVWFQQKVAKPEKVASALLFLQEVAKSERWPLYSYFRKRWPSQ